MKYTSYSITAILCLLSSLVIGQCDVDLFITNAQANGSTYTFDIEIRSNIGDFLLADSDFTIIDADGTSNFSGGVSISGIPGTDASGGGTTYTVNFSAPPAFSPTIGNSATSIGTVTIEGYKDGGVQLEWNSAILNYFDTDNDNQQLAINDICFSNVADQLLPVKLTYFTARENERNEVQLDWETELEEQNAGFEVQHSLDGSNWKVLDFVLGKGTTQITQRYQFHHKGAPAGTNYYRLKQIDVDGAFEYSHIESISLKGFVAEFVVYPNPSTDIVHVYVDKGEVEGSLQLVDQVGRRVGTYTLDQYTNTYTLQLGHYPSGVYYLSLSLGGDKFTKRLVLQH